MPKAGRDLERLVARLERVLARASDHVTITSPDQIWGVESETIREVDVTVRCRVGSADVLVAFECRDRR